MSSVALPVLSRHERALLASHAPETPDGLHAWLRLVVGVNIARVALTPGAGAPFDYITHAFFEDRDRSLPRDSVVWAARGSGKTFLAAVATMLDLLFKPGVEVRILAGSLEQGRRMHAHLRALFSLPQLAPRVQGRITDRRIVLANGSVCEIMAQSQTSVRGAHPQILRCDEVELFDPEVWQAAQLLPRSARCGGIEVHAAIEAFSTMHRAGGLMSEVVGDTENRRVYRWSVIDVLERCETNRACESCELDEDCEGRARRASGHVRIDDAIGMKRRTASSVWDAEMLCLRPSRDDAVYPEFDANVHVAPFDSSPLTGDGHTWICGMDFGFRAPTVILWASVDASGVVRVVDERSVEGVVLDSHIEAIERSPWPRPRWIGVDPAGRQRNDQTGVSAVTALRRAGFVVRDRRAVLSEGVRLVRARLAPASGSPSLFIHPRCSTLIDSLTRYRYATGSSDALNPAKDGADHAADALRYMITPLDLHSPAHVASYW